VSSSNFIQNTFSLQGKNALVTGGNSGLGHSFAKALALAGANIFIPSLSEDTHNVVAEFESYGVKCSYINIDISKKGSANKILSTMVKEFSSIDILVNNAGICRINDVSKFGRDDWDPMVDVNLTAAFELIHETAKFMISQKSGKVINICSLFSYLGGIGSPAYAATKHGIAGLTKAYCDELAKYNIQVNGIAPGYYATDITKQTRENPESNKKVLDHIPANRWGEVEDLMGSVVFLASNASNYINGHIITVDGGYLVR
jgi:NAD(P)-dependent dehydrogenase (short-subunit alcohol dehydrogenase family)